ncbi:hypothetical protein DEFDS_P028 (plasmid) [Deferribacter desulfuricans SSM1]|uniref:Uncharacterized protein n=1 Tax=Deferribacter desulfuricans (strain DSM 14783 / JCM 11476 / NBRC 101012 / SSM1) TaxID=639282 RepID=D3PEL4_DEFDS|nr:hypothetical protein [Deferribacter desulfuricans]BAI81656.1 hypothetical protein DEFDS_P028 [Deferribacter desulfuricans SSM1]
MKKFCSKLNYLILTGVNYFLIGLTMAYAEEPDYSGLVSGTDKNVSPVKKFFGALLNEGVTGTAVTILCWLAIMYGSFKAIGEFFFANDDDARRESAFKRLLKASSPAIGGAVILLLRTQFTVK